MRPRRGAGRGRRVALLLAVAVLAYPVWVVGGALVRGRDLAGAWRAWRGPHPELADAPVALPPAPFAPARVVGSLLDPELVEVSGLAGSQRGADVLWAVNDGGNEPRLHALALDGRRLRAFDLDSPETDDDEADWEDLASFRFEGAPLLLVADVGDNQAWRPSVRLFVVPEPDLADAQTRIAPSARIELRYEDGPRDCEAVAVDPETATLLLISKRTAPPVLYGAELAPALRAGGGSVVARALGPVAVPPPTRTDADALVPTMLHMPTALDLEPGGGAAFVLGYVAGWRFPRAPGESWAAAFARPPEQLALPPLALAEAAAYHGGALYVTGEIDTLALVRWRPPLVKFEPLR